MARLFGCTSLEGEQSSLKAIDPLDCYGDGLSISIVGDRAVVVDDGKFIFYSFEEEVGHSDSGFDEILPSHNAGDFYWKCRGYTKNTFTGMPSGAQLTHGGSLYPPVGFTAETVPYTEESFVASDLFTSEVDWSYYGAGIYDGVLYILNNGSAFVMIDMDTGTITEGILSITPTGSFYDNVGWCQKDPSAAHLISNILTFDNEPTYIELFDMKNRTLRSVDITFPGDWVDWDTETGGTDSANSVRFGKWHYLLGGNYSTLGTLALRINVLNGQLERLTPVPNSTLLGWSCIDFTNELIYIGGTWEGQSTFQYNIGDNSWAELTGCPHNEGMWTDNIALHDPVTNSLVVPVYGEGTYVYDIDGDSWTRGLVTWDHDFFYGSYAIFIEGEGSLWPFGYSDGDTFQNVWIRNKNPVIITKE